MSDYLKPKNYCKYKILSEELTINSDGQNKMEVPPESGSGNPTDGLLANRHGSTAGPRGHQLPGQDAAGNMTSSASILATSSGGAAVHHPPLGQAVLNPSAAANASLIHQQEKQMIRSQLGANDESSMFGKNLNYEIEAAHCDRPCNLADLAALNLTGLTISSADVPPLASTHLEQNSTIMQEKEESSILVKASEHFVSAADLSKSSAESEMRSVNITEKSGSWDETSADPYFNAYLATPRAPQKTPLANAAKHNSNKCCEHLKMENATLRAQVNAETKTKAQLLRHIAMQNDEMRQWKDKCAGMQSLEKKLAESQNTVKMQSEQLAKFEKRLQMLQTEKEELEHRAEMAEQAELGWLQAIEDLRSQNTQQQQNEPPTGKLAEKAILIDLDDTVENAAVEEDEEYADSDQESDDESVSAPESEYSSSETTATEDERDGQPVAPPSIRPYVAAAEKMDFLRTIQNKDLLEEFRMENQTTIYKIIPDAKGDGKQQMIGDYRCNRRKLQEKCQFKILAIQSENGSFDVFKSGDHNHTVLPSSSASNSRALGGKNSNWIPMQTVRTEEELEILRQDQRVHIYKYIGGKKRQFRCYRYVEERCPFKLMAVTEDNGEIRVFRWDQHNSHGAQK